ncbi:MAG: ABC transporter ATP-binding protein/permease [Treponema sp.]|nr:ABC transporter ATP-binding protein/permease [Treponema sp.]
MLKTALHFLRFGYGRLSRANRALFFSVAVAAALSLAAAALMPILQRNMIEGAQSGEMRGPLALAMFAASIVGIFCVVYESLALNRLGKRVVNRLHKEMIASALRYGSAVIETRGSGGYLASMNGDGEAISRLMQTNYFSVALVFLQTIFVIIIASTWSPVFVAVVAPVYALSLLGIFIANKFYAKYAALARENMMKANPAALERLENRLSILGFANASAIEADLFADFDARDSAFIKRGIASDLSESVVRALQAAGLIALFLLSMNQISAGNLGIASFVAMLSYYAGVFVPLSAAQKLAQGMGDYKLHYDRMEDALTKTPIVLLPKSRELTFEGCAFSYGAGDSGRIEGLNLSIDRRLGLVGLSGEGKTTIVKILMGRVAPQNGACLLGGVETGRVAKAVLHSALRLYGQDNELFDDTLEYNVALKKIPLSEAEYSKAVREIEANLREEIARAGKGRPRGRAGETIQELFLLNDWQRADAALWREIDAELSGAGEMAGMFAELIAARKFYRSERYEALLDDLGIRGLAGRSFGQHGKNISGGEKNKVCLARFLLPAQNGFYVIDEPFTAVDAISEEQCLSALQMYLARSAGITISHKLNVIRALSDEIVVLNQGAICERGEHEALVQSGGLYAELYGKFLALK